jgi:hypothetical protein
LPAAEEHGWTSLMGLRARIFELRRLQKHEEVLATHAAETVHQVQFNIVRLICVEQETN